MVLVTAAMAGIILKGSKRHAIKKFSAPIVVVGVGGIAFFRIANAIRESDGAKTCSFSCFCELKIKSWVAHSWMVSKSHSFPFVSYLKFNGK